MERGFQALRPTYHVPRGAAGGQRGERRIHRFGCNGHERSPSLDVDVLFNDENVRPMRSSAYKDTHERKVKVKPEDPGAAAALEHLLSHPDTQVAEALTGRATAGH